VHPPPAPAPAETSTAWPFAALLVANVALAFGPWFVRMTEVGPVAAAFWRIALATPVLFALAAATGTAARLPVRGVAVVLALSGLLFAGDLASWHVGIHLTKLANATLFGNAATFVFPLWAFAVARAWPTRIQGVALALAAMGAALLMGRSYQLSPENLGGDLLCLVAGVLYAGYFILMARARETLAPLPALAWSSAAASGPLLVAALAAGERVIPGTWSPLILLALCGQVVGQGLMIYALGRLPALVIGLALLTQPVVAAAIGWAAYGERLGAADLVGAAMVAAALVLVRIARPRVTEVP